jgi:4-hydroxybenzoate polyprenyltransferase
MIKSFFRLIRWPNLIIILASMIFMLWFIIKPGLGLTTGAQGLTILEFVLLVLAVVFTAVGGYIINDIKDVKSDMINKPGRNEVGLAFTAKQAYGIYLVFAIAGVVFGTVVSILLHKIGFSLIFLLTAGLLWFYANAYQCQPLTGNLVVAFLSALSFALVFLYELFAFQLAKAPVIVKPDALHLILTIVLIYMSFAFLVSLIREVLKDIEDVKGDEQTGCHTYAVVYGTQNAKIVALVVEFIGLLAAFWFQWYFYGKGFYLLVIYFSLIDILFGWIIVKTLQAKEKSHFYTLSVLTKVLMLAGILSMVLFYFEF